MNRIYISGEQFDYKWTEEQLNEFIQLWESGTRRTPKLAKHFRRNYVEVAILVMDLAERNVITRYGRGSKPIFEGD